MSFVIAGRDTTSVALSWVFWELTQHPDATAKCGARRNVDAALILVIPRVVDELDRVLQGADPTYADVTVHLKYLIAVINESLRLHAPFPSVCSALHP